MTNYETGQDVLVKSDSLFNGEAFIAAVDEEEAMSDGTLYIDLRGRHSTDAELALVLEDDVLALTEVFDTIKALHSGGEIQQVVRDAIEESNRTARRKA